MYLYFCFGLNIAAQHAGEQEAACLQIERAHFEAMKHNDSGFHMIKHIKNILMNI